MLCHASKGNEIIAGVLLSMMCPLQPSATFKRWKEILTLNILSFGDNNTNAYSFYETLFLIQIEARLWYGLKLAIYDHFLMFFRRSVTKTSLDLSNHLFCTKLLQVLLK